MNTKIYAHPISQAVTAAIDVLCQAIDRDALSHDARLRVAQIVRRAIVPRRTPGPKNQQLDSAYADYRAGLRGLKLYRNHIPDYAKLSLWRRREKQNRLLKALQKRTERERKRQKMPTIPANGLSPRQTAPLNGQPDNAS